MKNSPSSWTPCFWVRKNGFSRARKRSGWTETCRTRKRTGDKCRFEGTAKKSIRNTMKFYYAGSNVYGQIINAGPEIVDSFTCHEDHNFRELVDSGHFCSLFRHCDGNLHLYGAANQKTFQTLELEDTKDVSQARALDDKVMLLKANGDLFKIDLEDTSSRVKLPNFTRVESADHSDQLVQLAFSRTMNVLLTSNNNLFNLSSRLDVKQESISDFRTGIEHCLVLTESGNIYTFGQGRYCVTSTLQVTN